MVSSDEEIKNEVERFFFDFLSHMLADLVEAPMESCRTCWTFDVVRVTQRSWRRLLRMRRYERHFSTWHLTSHQDRMVTLVSFSKQHSQ